MVFKRDVNGDTRVRPFAWSGLTLVLLVLMCCALVVSSTGCAQKKEARKTDKVVNVKVMKVTRQVERPFVEAVGSLEPREEVLASSEVDGVLRDVPVEEGDSVLKGQALAIVNDTDYRLAREAAEAALKQAEANHANAAVTFGRMEALFRQQVISKQEYDNAQTRLDVTLRELERARSQLALSKEKLAKTVVRSPIAGEVKQKLVSAGDFVGAGKPLVRVVDAKTVKLIFSVPEKDISRVRKGQDVGFQVDAYPGRDYAGTVHAVLPSLDERSRMLEVQALASNASGELKPGMFAKVKVYVGEERPVVVVPITSVLYEGTRTRVFVAESGVARVREVRLGAKYGELVEVVSGVEEGETLIVVGQNAAADGVKIRVVD